MTFNLPDATNRVLWGATTPGYLAEQLPNITGTFKADSYYEGATGAFVTDSTVSSPNVLNWINNGRTYSFNASRVSSAYVDDGIVRPAALGVIICIKY